MGAAQNASGLRVFFGRDGALGDAVGECDGPGCTAEVAAAIPSWAEALYAAPFNDDGPSATSFCEN